MADLALNDALIDEYLKFKFQEDYKPDIIRKLFKYIQPFPLREDFYDDPSIMMQLENDPLIEIVDDCSDEDLVQESVLKLMLVDSFISLPYRILNINDRYEKLKPKYSGTYPNKMGKDKAQEHIKALLSDAEYVIITDAYISSSREWSNNKNIIQNIIPLKSLDLTILGADKDKRKTSLSASEKSQLQSLFDSWSVNSRSIGENIHDRYIETDKLKILLSSGLCHLDSSSIKDFTYVIEIK